MLGVALANGASVKGDVRGRGGSESAHASTWRFFAGRSAGGNAPAPPAVPSTESCITLPSLSLGAGMLAVPAAPSAEASGWDANSARMFSTAAASIVFCALSAGGSCDVKEAEHRRLFPIPTLLNTLFRSGNGHAVSFFK